MEEIYKGIKIKIDETHDIFRVYLDKKYLYSYSDYASTKTLFTARGLIDDYLNAIKKIGKTVIQINSSIILKIDTISIQGNDILYLTKEKELIARRNNNDKIILENNKKNLNLLKDYNNITEKIYNLEKEKSVIENKFDPILTVKIGDTWICRDGKSKYELTQVC